MKLARNNIWGALLAAALLFCPATLAHAQVAPPSRGGTGTSSAPAYGKLLIGNKNGGYDFVASSTFGGGGGGGGAVSSVFGRTGAVNAQSGDYTTSQITEGSNLYYTPARALASFVSNLAATSSVASITTLPSLSLAYGQLTGVPSNVSSFNTRTGAVTLSSGDVTTALGFTPYNATNPSSFISNATGLISAGTNVAITGSGTSGSPYVINAGYPFPSNATSTLLTFNGGLTAANTVTLSGITGSTQCLHVNSSGVVSGTGTDCGSSGGSVTGVTGTYPIISSGGTAPAISIAFGTTTNNTWAGLQTFTNSSTTLGSFSYASSTLGYFGTLNLPNLVTPAGSFLAVNTAGQVIATTTPSGGSGSVGSGTTGQFPYYAANGTTLTATSTLFLATNGNVGVASTAPVANFSVLGSSAFDGTASFGGVTNASLSLLNTNAAQRGTITISSAPAFLLSAVGGGTSMKLVTNTATRLSIGSNGVVEVVTPGAANVSPFLVSGSIFSGGTGATTLPQVLVQPSSGAAAATTWNTGGTVLGVNTASGFAGNLLDFRVNGGATVHTVDSAGNGYFAGNVAIGTTTPYAQLALGGGNLVLGAASAGGTPGDLFLPKLGTAAGTFIAVDANGKIIATTTPAGGGTNYFSNSGASTYLSTGSNLGVGTSTPHGSLSVSSTVTTPSQPLFEVAQANGSATSTQVLISTTTAAYPTLNIGSTTASGALPLIVSYASTASTTGMLIEATSGGGCIIIKDTSGAGYTQLYAQAGSLSSKVHTGALSACN